MTALLRKPEVVASAEDVLREREFFAAFCEQYPDRTDVDADTKYPALSLLARDIRRGSPYLWQDGIRMTAATAALPRHVIPRDAMPEPLMWWTFPTGIEGGGDAVLLTDVRDGVQVLSFEFVRDRLRVSVGGFGYGRVFPEDFVERPDYGAWVRGHLGMFAFLRSPYVTARPQQATRAGRRRLVHERIESAAVHFVDLRRVVRDVCGEADAEREHEWSGRWWVGGHYRAQWYPSLSAHRVIWVAPYVKGPDDKPLIERAYRVRR